MDDLDALLADLESTTSHIKQKAQQANQQTDDTSLGGSSRQGSITPASHGSPIKEAESREMTPPPLPAHPSSIMYEDPGVDQPIYETTMVKNAPYASIVRTEKPQQRSALSHNLSELDSLLQDLSSAQFLAEVDRRSGSNYEEVNFDRGRPRDPQVLNGSVPEDQIYDNRDQHPNKAAASSATRELDDLMESLADFKVGPKPPTPGPTGDATYAVVQKSPKTQGAPAQYGQAVSQAEVGGAKDNQIEAMLDNLQTDMNRQGITTVPKGHCAACAKPIIGQVITALGKIWHPEHFVCAHCSEELGTCNFFEKDGQPFCERDYHQLFSPRCAYCNGPILDKCMTAMDKTWHPEHFVCARCGRPFGEEGFHERDGKAYCRMDYYDLFAPKCGGCRHPIMESFISALNKQWHPQCFTCQECHVPFGAGSFFDHEGAPYCETHYHAKRGSLCAGCHKPITGRCITAMFKKFHPEHFVCAFCLKQLNKGTFKEQNDKPYCHPCYVKLFG